MSTSDRPQRANHPTGATAGARPSEHIRTGVWALGVGLLALGAVSVWAVDALLGADHEARRTAIQAPGAHAAQDQNHTGAARPHRRHSEGAHAAKAREMPGASGALVPSFHGAPPPGSDPQLMAMQRTLGRGGDAGVTPPFYPTYWRAQLTWASGDTQAHAGSTCEVRVLPVRTRQFNCLVRVTCGTEVLYPDRLQQAGFVPCRVENGVPVQAIDDGFTHQDGDPTVHIDLASRRVSISDDDPNGRRFGAELSLLPAT